MTPANFLKLAPPIARSSCFEMLSQLELVIIPLSDSTYTEADERRNAVVLLNLCASILLALDLHADAGASSDHPNEMNLHPTFTPPRPNGRPS